MIRPGDNGFSRAEREFGDVQLQRFDHRRGIWVNWLMNGLARIHGEENIYIYIRLLIGDCDDGLSYATNSYMNLTMLPLRL
jgi:hypothetical protein